jgi:DNA polymerase-3 subunit delta'
MIWEKTRGVDVQVTMFRRSIGRGRLSHAYLFVGPDGVGKKRFARSLAQCLFCERFADAELEACGECSGCRQMLAGTHPDFFLVERPPDKRELPLKLFIGERENRGQEGLCHDLSLRPMAGNRKIAVIDDAHLMTDESTNAILKTLEEPPPASLLILIAANTDDLLPTIRSRCQLVRFAPLPDVDVAALLVELEMVSERQEAEAVASLSNGSLAVAARLVDPAIRELRNLLYKNLADERFNSVAAAGAVIEGIQQLGSETPVHREAATWLLRFTLEFYRRVALVLAGDGSAGPADEARQFAERFQDLGDQGVETVMELFERARLAESHLEQNMPVPLCLEGLFNDLGRIGRAPSSLRG